jgi:diaminohydroxyphosphoribosylaminopyrimidine deaminase / 5-amino-6-(5-phosphoribosylamino)uracil reductase
MTHLPERNAMKRSGPKFMRRALDLAAAQGRYAAPNPKVGAVIVKKGRIVGEGAHRVFGRAHAEVAALEQAGDKARGGTLYVTLEPCSHYGKTPPCADAVIRAGIKKVVAASKDPYVSVRGKGFARLREAGVRVETGLLEKEARRLNEDFFFSAVRGRPKTILKAALSGDMKIAGAKGSPRWITGAKARRKAHELRSRVNAILVGSGTALKDDPSLTVRLLGYHREDGWPLRVVLDSKLKVPLTARLFKGRPKTVVFTSRAASRVKEGVLRKMGVLVFRVPMARKMLSLGAVLKVLHSLQVRSLLVEGGGEVHASFFREKWVEEVALFLSPKILGPKALPWMGGVVKPVRMPYLKNIQMQRVGEDSFLKAAVEY